MAGLVREGKVAWINTLYNCGNQKSISECTLNGMSYNSRRLHLAAITRLDVNRMLWAQALQNWTVELAFAIDGLILSLVFVALHMGPGKI